MGHALTSRQHHGRASEIARLAAKLIGIGVIAGLIIIYCQFLIDACFRGLH